MMSVLIIGDWRSWCGACGEGADPLELMHRTVLPGLTGTLTTAGCGVVWTHVAAEVSSRAREERIREMRPDLVYLPELVDPNELPFSAGASASAGATGSVTGRPGNSELGANAGKPRTPPEVTPAPGAGGPAAVPLTGPADDDPVWVAVRRRGIDAHRPDGPDHTACGRPMRPYGEQLLAAEARVAYSALLCTRCWPAFHVDHTRRVAPSRRSL